MSKQTNIDFKSWILFEDADYCIINKPPYIPCLPERGKKTAPDVLHLASEYLADPVLCHRIDRETSGVLVIAKNSIAYRNLSMQLEARTVKKVYHAIVDGVANFEELLVDEPINAEQLGKIKIDYKNGKSAATIFQTFEKFKHFTLVGCKPITGRLHQIRVHLKSLNYVIAGDILYGGKLPYLYDIKKKFKPGNTDNPLISRFALHAKKIGFNDCAGNWLEVDSDYAPDFELFLKLLHKWDN